MLIELTPEEISNSREVRGFLGSGDDPMSFKIAERRGGGMFLDSEEPEFRKLCLRDSVRTVEGVDERPFHIRLTGAQPYFANENILERDEVVAFDRQLKRTTRFERTDQNLPAPLGVGDGVGRA